MTEIDGRIGWEDCKSQDVDNSIQLSDYILLTSRHYIHMDLGPPFGPFAIAPSSSSSWSLNQLLSQIDIHVHVFSPHPDPNLTIL